MTRRSASLAACAATLALTAAAFLAPATADGLHMRRDQSVVSQRTVIALKRPALPEGDLADHTGALK